jgi:hypothetical protein
MSHNVEYFPVVVVQPDFFERAVEPGETDIICPQFLMGIFPGL